MQSFVSTSPIDADTKESVLRAMAAESRFHRRLLTDAMLGLHRRPEHGVRTVRSPSGIAYVFATYGREWKPEDRHADLFSRCVVTRGSTELGGEIRAVVGHGLVVDDPATWPFDLVYVDKPWDERDEAFAREMRDRFGFIRDATWSRRQVDEFPVTKLDSSERAKRNRAKRERRSRKRT